MYASLPSLHMAAMAVRVNESHYRSAYIFLLVPKLVWMMALIVNTALNTNFQALSRTPSWRLLLLLRLVTVRQHVSLVLST